MPYFKCETCAFKSIEIKESNDHSALQGHKVTIRESKPSQFDEMMDIMDSWIYSGYWYIQFLPSQGRQVAVFPVRGGRIKRWTAAPNVQSIRKSVESITKKAILALITLPNVEVAEETISALGVISY